MRVQEVAALVIDAPHGRAHLIIVVATADEVAPDRLQIARIEPHQPLEITRVADVHGVRERGH